MARRPDSKLPDKPLSPEELDRFREQLSRLTPHHVNIEYQRVYRECRMFGTELPPASAIQQLVQIYKQLWRWRRNHRQQVPDEQPPTG
jgi:hypothetical protein